MAGGKKRPGRGAAGKKISRGKLPSKRSINLILTDEKQVNPLKAIIGIALIAALAFLFGKYMVLDRLNEMSAASARASTAKANLEAAQAQLEGFGDIEDTFAHYTYADMTGSEINLVDRNRVLDLVASTLPGGDTALSPQEFINRVIALIMEYLNPPEEQPMSQEQFGEALGQLIKRIIPSGYRVRSWNVSDTNLSVQITGTSLERLNRLARQIEKSPIVDSCAIISANKPKQIETDEAVSANLIIYLQQPVEEAVEEGSEEASTEEGTAQ